MDFKVLQFSEVVGKVAKEWFTWGDRQLQGSNIERRDGETSLLQCCRN